MFPGSRSALRPMQIFRDARRPRVRPWCCGVSRYVLAIANANQHCLKAPQQAGVPAVPEASFFMTAAWAAPCLLRPGAGGWSASSIREFIEVTRCHWRHERRRWRQPTQSGYARKPHGTTSRTGPPIANRDLFMPCQVSLPPGPTTHFHWRPFSPKRK